MNTADILTALKEERAALQSQVDAASLKISQLDGAIAALEGTAPCRTSRNNGRSIPDMIEGAAREVGAGGKVFDNAVLVQAAIKLFGADSTKIKQGIYSAVAKLIRQKKLVRCAGGFQLAP